jgi:hypothetical protein
MSESKDNTESEEKSDATLLAEMTIEKRYSKVKVYDRIKLIAFLNRKLTAIEKIVEGEEEKHAKALEKARAERKEYLTKANFYIEEYRAYCNNPDNGAKWTGGLFGFNKKSPFHGKYIARYDEKAQCLKYDVEHEEDFTEHGLLPFPKYLSAVHNLKYVPSKITLKYVGAWKFDGKSEDHIVAADMIAKLMDEVGLMVGDEVNSKQIGEDLNHVLNLGYDMVREEVYVATGRKVEAK